MYILWKLAYLENIALAYDVERVAGTRVPEHLAHQKQPLYCDRCILTTTIHNTLASNPKIDSYISYSRFEF